MCACRSMKPGETTSPVASMTRADGSRNQALARDRDDAAAAHQHVGTKARSPGAVDDGSASDEDLLLLGGKRPCAASCQLPAASN